MATSSDFPRSDADVSAIALLLSSALKDRGAVCICLRAVPKSAAARSNAIKFEATTLDDSKLSIRENAVFLMPPNIFDQLIGLMVKPA